MYKCKYKSIFVLRDLEIATLMSCNLGCMHRNVICCLFRNASLNLQHWHLSLSIFAKIWRNTSGSSRLLEKSSSEWSGWPQVVLVPRHGGNGCCALDRVPQRRRQSLCFALLLGSCPAVLDVRRERMWWQEITSTVHYNLNYNRDPSRLPVASSLPRYTIHHKADV